MKEIKQITVLTSVILVAGLLSGCKTKHNKADTYETVDTYQALNVLLITADDLNYNSVGAYGCKIRGITPNIDRLAGQGLMFTNAFVNIAVCQPCRQSIMTGRYPHRNGAMGFEAIDNDVPTLQEQLHEVGYLNGIIGKEKHLMPMNKYCWDFCIREEDVASGSGIGRDPELYYK